MIYEVIPSPPHLRKLVRHYWFIEQDEGQNAKNNFKLMAEGFPNLIFQYNSSFRDADNYDECFPPVIFHGQTGKPHNVAVSTKFGVCGIGFYPQAIPLLFKIDAGEVANKIIDGANILNGCIHELEDKIANAKNVAERVSIFTKFLSDKIASVKRADQSIVEYTIEQIVNQKGVVKIDNIAIEMKISRRQLERKFFESVGFSPKFYSRIIRFESTLLYPSKSITDIAYSFDYADQAHFTREFKEFSGMCPKAYFKEERETAENFVEIE